MTRKGAKREKGGKDSKYREGRTFGASRELGSSPAGQVVPPLCVSLPSPVQQDPLTLSTHMVS